MAATSPFIEFDAVDAHHLFVEYFETFFLILKLFVKIRALKPHNFVRSLTRRLAS